MKLFLVENANKVKLLLYRRYSDSSIDKTKLCPPAAAISKARRAWACPFTSCRSAPQKRSRSSSAKPSTSAAKFEKIANFRPVLRAKHPHAFNYDCSAHHLLESPTPLCPCALLLLRSPILEISLQAIDSAVLNCFSNVVSLQDVVSGEVGNGAPHFEDAIAGSDG